MQRAGGKQVHIFYVHGIGSDGPGDFDSWSLRKGICDLVRDCTSSAGKLDEPQREYADQDEFSLNAPPPTLEYLGQPVWRNSEEWNAAAPFVVHWKLMRAEHHPTIYVDEINWWPLVFSLKCRQIVESDAALVGPDAERIKLCSTLKPAEVSGRFISYNWIPAEDARSLLNAAPRGAVVNRKLKNGLLDWGLSDAVLALGPLRSYLLDGIRQLILKSIAVSPEGDRGDAAGPTANQEYVIVSHSLGSYLIFAALDISPATSQTPTVQRSGDTFEQILGRTPLVYFFANQLRLLELASLDQPPGKSLLSHLEAWARLRCEYEKSVLGDTHACVRPQIISLNDPSDLLTWTVPELATVEVHNVVVKNSTHWLGLIESPTKAHNNYAKNKNAIGQMLKLNAP